MSPKKIALINTAKIMVGGIAIGVGVNLLYAYVSPTVLLGLFIAMCFIALGKLVYDTEKMKAELQQNIRK